MILDATAGNRMMWRIKDSDNVIFIDRQTKLAVKPTIFCSNEQTPFMDKSFDTIIYDPPHKWGEKKSYFSFPNKEGYNTTFKKGRKIPTYYGWDIYMTRGQLIRHMYKAQQEFHRILKDDGLLWVKWCELKMTTTSLQSMLDRFMELIHISVRSPFQRGKKNQTVWMCMQKKKDIMSQTLLL